MNTQGRVPQRIGYHTELRVWESSRRLARAVYTQVARFPSSERFGLTDQLRRCAVSVPANIAEGCGRGTTKELIRSLRLARGSLAELHSHLTLAQDFGYIRSEEFELLASGVYEVRRMLNALIGALNRNVRSSMSGS